MKMKEVIALALAGYKKKDIDDLLAMEINEDSEETQEEVTDESVDEEKPDKEREESSDEVDYESLYKETLDKLKKAQADNVHKDAEPEHDSDEDILANLVKDFM